MIRIMEPRDPVQNARRPGIYLLPNLLTTANIFAGFYAVIAASQGRFEIAAIAIFVAMIMDGLDGRVARMLNAQSDFGAQYDSLADMVTFGIAPALVAYHWAQPVPALGKLVWLAAFAHAVGAALRLARFNTQVASADKRYFQGLASPAAAAIVVGFIWFAADRALDRQVFALAAAAVCLVSGSLMVSTFRYHSFKQVDWSGRVRFITITLAALLLILIAWDTPLVLFLGFAVYAVWGPVFTVFSRRRARMQGRQAESRSL